MTDNQSHEPATPKQASALIETAEPRRGTQQNLRDDWTTQVFLSEVLTQCSFALIAHSDIEAALQQCHPGDAESKRLFYSIQAFLSACANAAKLLWPRSTSSRHEKPERVRHRRERGNLLRRVLNIPDEDTVLVVLRNKELRNYFEHFDERLDEWAITSAHHILMTRCSGAPGSFMIAGMGPNDTMGYLDHTTGEVTFQDVVVSLPQMYAAVENLYGRVERVLGAAHLHGIEQS